LVGRLFPLVLDAAASQFDLQKYSSASKGSSRGDYSYSSWPDCYKDEERGRRDAGNVVGLYQQLLRSNGKKAFDLLGKIQLQTESLPNTEQSRLVIPLLQQMIDVVDRRSPHSRQFYQSMIATYITQVVQKEPGKPKDWSRPSEIEGCCWAISNCPTCQLLHEFLMNPREESRRFVLDKSGHLKYSVPARCNKSYESETVLIVTKTLKGWEENHMKWQKRASEAQETFKLLP
jgi:hypothetical protein